jgi:hypothetical protein
VIPTRCARRNFSQPLELCPKKPHSFGMNRTYYVFAISLLGFGSQAFASMTADDFFREMRAHQIETSKEMIGCANDLIIPGRIHDNEDVYWNAGPVLNENRQTPGLDGIRYVRQIQEILPANLPFALRKFMIEHAQSFKIAHRVGFRDELSIHAQVYDSQDAVDGKIPRSSLREFNFVITADKIIIRESDAAGYEGNVAYEIAMRYAPRLGYIKKSGVAEYRFESGNLMGLLFFLRRNAGLDLAPY